MQQAQFLNFAFFSECFKLDDGLSLLFVEFPQFKVFIHVLLDLFARVESKVTL